ncbi:hypothetical protein [Streptomyces tibetensis]|uniref:hypothetical protein n=1 Tax=Streptomyces tibetensis TaxID=2382123 RepID=UPI0033E02E55
MNGKELDPGAFRFLIPSLPPTRISSFLESCGWALVERREGLLEHWEEPHGHSPQRRTYLLPLNREMRDFDRRFAEFLAELAQHFECNAAQLAQLLTSEDWDTLFLRTNSTGREDSVGLAQAANILSVGMRMLELSALHTANPQRFTRRGTRSVRVKDYLRDGLLLGHTERGSYIFPIYSRVEEWGSGSTPFGRHVVVNLARALDRVRSWPELHERGEEDPRFDLEVAKALQPLTSHHTFESLEISFQWAPSQELPADIPDNPLVFEMPTIRAVTQSAASQQRTPPPAGDRISKERSGKLPPSPPRMTRSSKRATTASEGSRISITGYVVAIGIDDRDRHRTGSPYFVVVRAAENEFTIPVTREWYDFAVHARDSGQVLTATGTLGGDDDTGVLYGAVVRSGDRTEIGVRIASEDH